MADRTIDEKKEQLRVLQERHNELSRQQYSVQSSPEGADQIRELEGKIEELRKKIEEAEEAEEAEEEFNAR